MTLGEEYSPTVDWASPDLFGLVGTLHRPPHRRRGVDGRGAAPPSGGGLRTTAVPGREPGRRPHGGGLRRRDPGLAHHLARGRRRPADRRSAAAPTCCARCGTAPDGCGSSTGGTPHGRSRSSPTATGSVSTGPELRDVRLEAAAVSRDGSRFVVLARLPDGEVEARLFRVVRDDLGAPAAAGLRPHPAGAEHAAPPARDRLVGPDHGRGHDAALGILDAGAAAADRRGDRRGHRGAPPGPALRVRSDDGRLARVAAEPARRRRRAATSSTSAPTGAGPTVVLPGAAARRDVRRLRLARAAGPAALSTASPRAPPAGSPAAGRVGACVTPWSTCCWGRAASGAGVPVASCARSAAASLPDGGRACPPTPSPPGLAPPWCAAEYAGVVRQMVLAHKERACHALARPLGRPAGHRGAGRRGPAPRGPGRADGRPGRAGARAQPPGGRARPRPRPVAAADPGGGPDACGRAGVPAAVQPLLRDPGPPAGPGRSGRGGPGGQPARRLRPPARARRRPARRRRGLGSWSSTTSSPRAPRRGRPSAPSRTSGSAVHAVAVVAATTRRVPPP